MLVRDVQKSPLQIIRGFELEPGVLTVIVINPTAGVMGGDAYRIRVEVRGGARVVLLTQSATKIHRMEPDQQVVQDIEFLVCDGTRLEYYPQRTIPFAGSSFVQSLRANLESGA